MRGCAVRISLDAFLNAVGLDNTSDVRLFHVEARPDYNEFTLYLASDDREDFPILTAGQKFPPAHIVCERTQAHFELYPS